MPHGRPNPDNQPKKKLTQALLMMGETTGLSVTEDVLELRREDLAQHPQGTHDRDGVQSHVGGRRRH